MNKLKRNPLITLFENLKILDSDKTELFHKGTRDIKQINVLIDNDSGSLILDKCVEDLDDYYLNNTIYTLDEHKTLLNNNLVNTPPLEDDIRRFELYKNELKDLSILDFGCGKGGFLKKIKEQNISSNLTGVELNKINRKNINLSGIDCFSKLEETKNKFDLIFLNHVFEHLTNPIEIIKELKKQTTDSGKIIIEIPHGDDFLIKKSNVTPFKDFTFWSEHICLYTEKLIRKLFNKIEINDFHISYYQRYNMNNHLNWFNNKKPGGHTNFKVYDEPILKQYNKYLIEKKMTDTLMIVIGENSKDFSDKIWN